ncbi:MAG: hypothetical protein ACK4VV_09520 [Pseudomonas sp.]
MPQVTRIHEIVHHKQLERDEWFLVRDPTGRRYVLFETVTMDSRSSPPLSKKREMSVQTILAQNNELARKLRIVLEQ